MCRISYNPSEKLLFFFNNKKNYIRYVLFRTVDVRVASIKLINNNRYFFLFNNQPDALIIPILFRYKTLHVSGIFSAHHQQFSTVHSALVIFRQVSDDRFQAESGWNGNLHETYQCRKYSRNLLMMGRKDARNM
jgi:RNase P/RNase MRP subunit POP5